MVAELLENAKSKDVLLLGTSARDALGGPLVARLLAESACNTVLLYVQGEPTGRLFSRLMVASDGSVFTRGALELALAFAELTPDTHVSLVHVVPPKVSVGPGARPNLVRYLIGDDALAVRRSLEPNLARTLDSAHELVAFHVISGPDPVRALQAHAQGSRHDLVVIGGERQKTGVQVFSGHRLDALLDMGCSVALVVPRVVA
jgi:hypothetical protein